MVAQFAERLGTKVTKFMVLPVSPDVLHRVKLRGIGRQVLQADGVALLGHKVLHQPAPMRFGAVPDHQKLLSEMTLEMRDTQPLAGF